MDEQLSLFENLTMSKEEFADRLLKELNSLDTVFKDQFFIKEIRLNVWNHIKSKNKNLEIYIDAKNRTDDNNFIQFKGDKQSQLNLYNADALNEWIGKMSKDKDFSYSVTPWFIAVYYHNWEFKKIHG